MPIHQLTKTESPKYTVRKLQVRAVNRLVAQPKPWNQGPKPGTRTAFQQMRAAGVSVNEINVGSRRWKKAMKKYALKQPMAGRVERIVASCINRELWRQAEDRIYGGP